MTEHPGLTFVTALYRCRELGAALERFASAGTLYNVRRSLAAGAGGQCPRGGVNCAQGRMPGPVRPAAAAAGTAANWRRQDIQVGVNSAARRVPGRPGAGSRGQRRLGAAAWLATNSPPALPAGSPSSSRSIAQPQVDDVGQGTAVVAKLVLKVITTAGGVTMAAGRW